MTGGISYQPGLINATVRNVHAVLNGTLAGCRDLVGRNRDAPQERDVVNAAGIYVLGVRPWEGSLLGTS